MHGIGAWVVHGTGAWCMGFLGLVYYLDGGVFGLVRLDLWVGVGSG